MLRPTVIITVTGYRTLNASLAGNPRFVLTVKDHGEMTTSSNASCNYGIRNGWTVDHVTKRERTARVKLTRSGRICELEWLDGDN